MSGTGEGKEGGILKFHPHATTRVKRNENEREGGYMKCEIEAVRVPKVWMDVVMIISIAMGICGQNGERGKKKVEKKGKKV